MRRVTVLLLLVLSALAACSSEDATDDAGLESSADMEDAAPDEAREDADRPADGDADQAAGDAEAPAGGELGEPAPVRTTARAGGRLVVRTAEIELLAQDPDETADEVMRLSERVGGFVATTDLRRDEEDLLRGTITLRVPSEDLLPVVDEIEQLGVRAAASRIDERDVTDETSDLEASLTNLTSYERELRSLLADVREDTTSPDDLLRIFERIREVRGEIDTIEGRLATLSDQVALATVVVHLEPAGTAGAVTDATWEPAETLHAALAAAARGLSRVVDGVIWLTVGVLPVLLVLSLPVVAVAAGWRRARRLAPRREPGATG